MSRVGDLYLRAVANTRPPVRRFYFDTEPLRHGNWPFVDTTALGYCFGLAITMGAELCIPEPALHERREQWVREILAGVSKTTTSATDVQKTLKLVGLGITVQLPKESLLRTKYAEAEAAALKHYSLQQVPYPIRSLDEIFRMAVSRELPFEERKDGVVGLQDCVIFLSAADHREKTAIASAFVSNDAVFTKISSLIGNQNELRLIRGVAELQEILGRAVEPSFDTELRQMLDYLKTRIDQLLTDNRHSIQSFLDRNITLAELERLFGKVVSKEPPAIVSFGAIRPEMKGAQGDPLPFSCDVSVSYAAHVEQTLFSSGLLAVLAGEPNAESGPRETRVVSRRLSVTVELSAEISADYATLQLRAARIREPFYGDYPPVEPPGGRLSEMR